APPEPVEELMLADVMESLLLDRAEEEPAAQPSASETTFDDVASLLESSSDAPVSDQETATVYEAIKQQIFKQWSPPAGAQGIEGLTVLVAMTLSTEGYVLAAKVISVDGETPGGEAIKQVLADSALRAVLYFQDHHFLNLPMDRHDLWRNLKLRFDPSSMLRS
ncbi:MAG: hypothetical protein HOL02_15300, partial [Rhodospirillaceae bacterium]|nr:hypothetical protein [Rhodospirillaceae bacterium]